MTESKCKWVRLGDYIIARNERNTDLRYGIELIEGINSDGEFQPTKAKTDGIDLKPYKAVRSGDIAYNPSRLNIGSLAFRERDMCIVSHLYQVFHIKEECAEELLPEYLLLYFRRKEFLRIVDYSNYGSQRAEFNLKKLGELMVPLPPISTQRQIVNAWKSLREVKEQNESIAAPLMQVCQSYIQELKHKYEGVEIGEFIEEVDERNTNLEIKLSQGISNNKHFQDPKQVAANSKSDKIVRRGYFGYNRATTRNGEKISIAYRDDEDCTVSSAYGVFKITKEEKLNPYFLWMWVSRPEFDRYARYMSKGSAHEFFEMDDMKRVRIPLPPLSVQQAIVNIYNCANEAKKIAAEADRMSREVCSALIQHAIHQ